VQGAEGREETMQAKIGLFANASLLMVLVIVCILAAPSQKPPYRVNIPTPSDPISHGGNDPVMAGRQTAELNLERHREMVSDTNKLLKLARELNYEVSASGTNNLSPDDLRRLAEIERLARSVKEKMVIAGQAAP
jgi:hypothetical protein